MAFGWDDLLGGGIALAGALFGGEEGQAGSGGGIYTPEEYPWTKPMLESTANYQMGVLSNANQGKFAPWYEAAMPTIRAGMKRGVDETYYGTPGNRGEGLVNQEISVGAMTGVGPKASVAGARKAGQKYATAIQQIDEYLYGKGVDITNEQTKASMYYAAQAPRAPQSYAFGGYPATPGDNSMQKAMMGLGASIGANDWGSWGEDTNKYAYSSAYNSPFMDWVNAGGSNSGADYARDYGLGISPNQNSVDNRGMNLSSAISTVQNWVGNPTISDYTNPMGYAVRKAKDFGTSITKQWGTSTAPDWYTNAYNV